MKETTIVILIIGFIVGIVLLSVSSQVNSTRKCEAKGGVNVYSYGSINCWKDGQYININ